MTNLLDDISVHDNFLVSYSVDAEAREIILQTVFRDKEPFEFTTVRFAEVAAYHFAGDDFQTILFDISESTVEKTVESNRQLFLDSKNYGWPMTYDSETDLLEKMSRKQMRAFLIESSCGMGGWVWAKEMSKQTRTVGTDEKAGETILIGDQI